MQQGDGGEWHNIICDAMEYMIHVLCSRVTGGEWHDIICDVMEWRIHV